LSASPHMIRVRADERWPRPAAIDGAGTSERLPRGHVTGPYLLAAGDALDQFRTLPEDAWRQGVLHHAPLCRPAGNPAAAVIGSSEARGMGIAVRPARGGAGEDQPNRSDPRRRMRTSQGLRRPGRRISQAILVDPVSANRLFRNAPRRQVSSASQGRSWMASRMYRRNNDAVEPSKARWS
jgi:hypothetical protein